jgi:hypothetical protein
MANILFYNLKFRLGWGTTNHTWAKHYLGQHGSREQTLINYTGQNITYMKYLVLFILSCLESESFNFLLLDLVNVYIFIFLNTFFALCERLEK